MSKTIKQKLKEFFGFSVVLCLLMGITPKAFADNVNENPVLQDTPLAIEKVESYEHYFALNSGKALSSKPIVLNSDNVTNAHNVKTGTMHSGKDNSVVWESEEGWVEYTFEAPQSGGYNLQLEFQPLPGKINNPEIMVEINNVLPFSEAERMMLSRQWRQSVKKTEAFSTDSMGNEVKPAYNEIFDWTKAIMQDKKGIYNEPFKFYFEKGINTIRIKTVRETIAISQIVLCQQEKPKTYTEYQKSNENQGSAKGAEIEKIQAERPDKVSSTVLTPRFDRSSAATEPADAAAIKLNVLGGELWSTTAQWASWKFEVKESGYYKIALKYRQNFVRGLYTVRKIYINDEILFDELSNVKFPYNNSWQTMTLGSDEDFVFYFEAGEYDIKLEVATGELSETLRVLDKTWEALGAIYQKIIMITGHSPDIYYDYPLHQDIPNLLGDMQKLANSLRNEVKSIEKISGKSGSVANQLITIAEQLETFIKRPYTITRNLSQFQDNISSLASWILERREQPLELDYLVVYPETEEPPSAKAGILKELWYQIKSFFYTFFTDYNNVKISSDYDNAIEVWVGSGRDQLYILRALIDNDFSRKYNTGVTLKLVSGGILTQAIMAGINPDVALDIPRMTPADLALRGALLRLDDLEGYDDVAKRFMKNSISPYKLEGETYALPQTEVFNMMFYRTDILKELGISAPNTWQEMLEITPLINRNKMEIGIPSDTTMFNMLLLQKNGNYFNDDKSATRFDEEVALDTFEEWCKFYTQHGYSLVKNDLNRFATGKMPITIMPYSFYCQLLIGAPGISGKWEMALLPGTQTDGAINRSDSSNPGAGTSVSPSSACVIMSDTKNPDASWNFLNWFTSTETQTAYGQEIESVLGTFSRYTPANIEVIKNLQWSERETELLLEQWQWLNEIPEVPGGYYVTRSINNAFRSVIYEDQNPREMLMRWNKEINREISRKRKAYGLS